MMSLNEFLYVRVSVLTWTRWNALPRNEQRRIVLCEDETKKKLNLNKVHKESSADNNMSVLYARQIKRLFHIFVWLGRFLFVLQKGGDSNVLIAVDLTVQTQKINSRHATVACCKYSFARWYAPKEAYVWTTDKTSNEMSSVQDLLHGSTR